MPGSGGAPKYTPDALASGGATQKPFGESGTPKGGGSGGVAQTFLKLAMRRLTGHGFAATKNTLGVKPQSNAMTMGSHGSIK